MLEIKNVGSAERVFRFFEEISAIPHGSGSSDAIAEYLVNFARERGLWYKRDEANNVIIRKSATSGYESRPAVVFQGHTDMVLAAEQDATVDLEREGLSLYVDGDFLKARGTTLGGDDGIAVAYALAILDAEDIPHPDFEAVFTSDEEIGLLGAAALDGRDVQGRLLINIDSDAEGVFTVGCAGGVRCDVKRNFDIVGTGGYLCRLKLSSLRGGHSGVEINCGRINAIEVLVEMLKALENIELISLECGNADNAIPRDANAYFISQDDISELLAKFCAEMKSELVKCGEVDCEVSYEHIDKKITRLVISERDTADVISLISKMPSGVLAMSSDVKGLVETSQNLGVLKLKEGQLNMTLSVRSSKGEKKREAVEAIEKIAKEYGATVTQHGEYPAWEYREDSYLRDVACRVYEDMYKKAPRVDIIHAGLECGLLTDKIEGLDCISLGPDNFDIHTPSERLSISSSVRVWEYLLNLLKNI